MNKFNSEKNSPRNVFHVLTLICLLAFMFFLQACASTQSANPKLGSSISLQQQQQLEKDWGIRVVGLRSTMTGMMVDFRYKIVDAKKAAPLLDINKKAYLLVEKSQARLGVPNSVKIGALRQTTHAKKVKEGRDFFILFGNPGARYIKPGDKATLVIGDMRVEHLTLL